VTRAWDAVGADRRRALVTIVATIAVGHVVFLGGTAFVHVWTADVAWTDLPSAKWALIHLSLAREATVASWWSSMILALGGVTALIWAAAEYGRGRTAARCGAWLLAGIVLLGLSIDEVGALHERLLGDDIAGASDAFQSPGPWLVPVVPAVLLLVLAVNHARGRRIGAAAWLGCLGTLSLTTVGIQERLETFDVEVRPVGWLLLEEGTELAGSLLIVAALLIVGVNASFDLSDLRAFHRRCPVRPVVIAGVLAVAFVVGSVLFEEHLGSSPANDQEGLPQWWFASSAAAAVAACLLLMVRQHAPGRATNAMGALAAVALLLSVHHGIDGTTWIELFGGRASAVRVALATLLVLPALAVLAWSASSAARVGALGVCAAIVLAFRESASDPLDVVALSATWVVLVWALEGRRSAHTHPVLFRGFLGTRRSSLGPSPHERSRRPPAQPSDRSSR
jgi:hypothetical protein